MSALRAWFDARAPRERLLLAVMLALLGVLAIWAGIVLPVTDGLASSRERHDDAVIRLAETRARLSAIADLSRGRVAAPAGALDAAVRASAERAGFTPQTLNQLGPDQVQVGLSSARTPALMAWVAALEREGVLVDTLQLTDNGDRTVAARLTLRARAS